MAIQGSSAGLVRALLEKLWEYSLAPITHRNSEQDDYRATSTIE
jgi:hypothetical protein